MKYVANGPVFVIAYLLFMIPTYAMALLGSNSTVLNAAGSASGVGIMPAFWVHLLLLLILCGIVWLRGTYVQKAWLVIFPILALAFDLVPVLNFIPMVPTAMHLAAIIIGVSSRPGT